MYYCRLQKLRQIYKDITPMYNDNISTGVLQLRYNSIFTDKIAPDNVIIDKAQEAFGLLLHLHVECTNDRGIRVVDVRDISDIMNADAPLHFIIGAELVFYDYKTNHGMPNIPDAFRQLFTDRDTMAEYFEALAEDFFDMLNIDKLASQATTELLDNEIDIIDWSKKDTMTYRYFYDKVQRMKENILRRTYQECILRRKDIREFLYDVYDELHELSMERSLCLIGLQDAQKSEENEQVSIVVENAPWGTAFLWHPNK